MAQKSYEWLSHIVTLLQDHNIVNKSALLTNLLNRNDVDINFQIPSNSCLKQTRPHLLGNTALHFLLEHRVLDVFKKFIECGAGVTIKNDADETVVHRSLDKYWKLKGKLKRPFVEAILSAQVSTRNTTNPRDKHGLSHFHAAVVTNNVEAVKFFLDHRGLLVAETIDENLKIFPGYTPLHLAARYSALDTAKLLLQRGADVNRPDARGMTPLHLLIERNLELVDWIVTTKSELVVSEFETNENLILLLAKNTNVLSELQVACTLRDTSQVELLLDRGADMERCVSLYSKCWSGYTALHFAAHFSIENVKLLVERGANVLAKDGNGVTPLDLCLQRFTPKDVHVIMITNPKLKSIVMSDGKTALADLILAMADEASLRSFVKKINAGVNLSIPLDSPVWQGYTPLHLAVIAAKKIRNFSDLCLDADSETIESGKYVDKEENLRLVRIELLLKLGADVNAQDFYGLSPVHLAFHSHKMNIAHYFLRWHKGTIVNLTDGDGLSYLHIAFALNRVELVEKFLQAGANVRSPLKSEICYTTTLVDPIFGGTPKYHTRVIPEKSTCLHIATREDNVDIARMALEHGADVHATDANGYTPLHNLLGSPRTSHWADLMRKYMTDLRDYTTPSGLSHLHVACSIGCESIVDALLARNANVEATIDPSSRDPRLARYLGFRPIHLAFMRRNFDIAHRLIDRDADLLKRSASGVSPLQLVANICKLQHGMLGIDSYMIPKIFSINNRKLMKILEEKTGLTELHVACILGDCKLVEKLLQEGKQDVDLATSADTPIWPNSTPLHIVLDVPLGMFAYGGTQIVRLLLQAGASVTLANGQGLTPVHQLYYRNFHQDCRFDFWAILQRIKDFNLDLTCPNHVSLLHIVCLHGALYAKQLTDCDVNRTIDHFANRHGGFSPLHCAAEGKFSSNVSLLLTHGVDVHRVDRYGNTALHVAARQLSRQVSSLLPGEETTSLEELIRAGSDIRAKNIYGQTPMDVLLKSGGLQSDLSTLCSKFGYDARNFNTVDSAGCNAIHRLILAPQLTPDPMSSEKCRFAIHQLWKLGCDLDLQDNEGKSPLHYAAVSGNVEAVCALLASGSDPNTLDSNGATVFSHMMNCEKELNLHKDKFMAIITHFCNFLRAMQLVGIYVHPVNADTYEKASKMIASYTSFRYSDEKKMSDDVLRGDIQKLATVKLGETPICLNKILFEKTIVRYPRMVDEKRRAIDELLRENISVLDKFLLPTIGILLLQYRKVLAGKGCGRF